jgi:hypothetical protein
MVQVVFVTSLAVTATALIGGLLWAATRTRSETQEPEIARTAEHWPLVASCGIGAWTWHTGGDRIDWDAAMFTLFEVAAGHPPHDVAQFVDLLSPTDRARVGAALQALSTDGGVLDAECTLAHSNRTVNILAMRVSWIRDAGSGTVRVIGICQDVSRRSELEAQNKEHARVAAFFAGVGAALTEKATLEVTLGKCATAMTLELDVAVCRIWTVDDTGTMLELKASAGIDGDLDRGPRRIPVEDFTNGVMGDRDSIGGSALHGFGGYPLLVDERLVGVLTMFSRRSLSPATITALAVVAKQLALGIEHRKADVVAFVAHDFNNLLTAIGVCVDLLKSRLPTGSLERHYVEDIETAATRAADLTRLLQTR